MKQRPIQPKVPSRATQSLLLLALAGVACSDGDAQKSWNALSTCLAGSSSTSPLATRVQQLRLVELASAGVSASKDAWPRRCGGYADDLYAALGTSGDSALLKAKLHERL